MANYDGYIQKWYCRLNLINLVQQYINNFDDRWNTTSSITWFLILGASDYIATSKYMITIDGTFFAMIMVKDSSTL